jgi:hypothetical protein
MPKSKTDVTVDQPGPSDERTATVDSSDRLDWDAKGDLPAPCHAPESVDRPEASPASS